MAKCVFMESLFSLIMVPKHKNVDFVANAGTPQTSHKTSFWWGGKQTEKLFWERKQPHSHRFLRVCHHNRSLLLFVISAHNSEMSLCNGHALAPVSRVWSPQWPQALSESLNTWLWIRRDRNYWTSLCKISDLGYRRGSKGSLSLPLR